MATLPGLRVGLTLDSATFVRETRRVEQTVRNMGGNIGKQTAVIERGFGRVNSAIGAARATLVGFGVAVGATGLISLGRQIISTSDQYAKLTGRLRLAIGDTESLARVQERLLAVSQSTRQELFATSEVFTRLAIGLRDSGKSAGDLLAVTEALAQAVAISGASTAEASAGLRQFSQGMSSGVLRGEELNSILEQIPRLAQAIAAGMDVPIGKLRELGAEGKLTTEVVLTALTSQAPRLAEEFANIPITVGDAMTKVRNSFTVLVGGTDQATGSTRELAEAISDLADLLSSPGFRAGFQSFIAEGVKRFSESLREIQRIAQGIRNIVGLFIDIEEAAAQTGDLNQQLQIANTELNGAGGAVGGLSGAASDAADALSEMLEQTRRENEQLIALNAAHKGYGSTVETVNAAIEIDNALRAEKISRLDAERSGLLELLVANKKLESSNEALAEAEKKRESLVQSRAANQQQALKTAAAETARLAAEPFKTALRSIQNSVTDTFEKIFSGGVTSFSDLADEAKRIFIRLAAEVATLAIFSPRAVLGAAGAAGAISPGAAAGGTQSLASSLGFGGIGNLINQFGGQLGFAVPAASGVGPPTAGFLGTTASFGSTLGFAGAGAAGGGLIGSQFGGQGALGGAVGGATGAAAGALIGSAFFGVGAPIGALIGGLIGTAAGGGIGSLFGGSERNRGVLTGGLGDISAQGTGDLDTVAAVVAGVDDAILDLLNIRQRQIVDQALRGTQIQTDFNEFDQNVGNFVAGERVRDISRALGFRASGVAPGSATADQAVQNLATALQVQRAIEDLTGAVSPFERQIEELNLQFEDLNEKARRFGISIDGLAAAQEKAAEDLRKAQDAQIGALLDPFEALINPLEAFQKQLEFASQNPAQRLSAAQADFDRIAAEALGGSTTALTQLAEAGALLIAQATEVGASPGGAAATATVAGVIEEALEITREAQDQASREVTNELTRLRREVVDTLAELVELTKAELRELKKSN